MVTTRRKSARFQNENDSESFGNLMAVDSAQEQFQASQQEKQSKKKRRSSEGGKKKRKSEAAVALVEENPIPIEILVYEQIDEELLKLIRQIYYSPRYECDDLEYRHVILPKQLYGYIPEDYMNCLLSETEWRSLGIRMSPGWQHYELHNPEPHIFLFRRTRTQPPPSAI